MVAFPPSPQRIQTLEALRAQIERLERGATRSSGSEGPVRPGNPAGWGDSRCVTSGVEALPGAPRATAPPPTNGVLPATDIVPTGWPSVDAWLPGGVPRGLVTEWFGLPEASGVGAPDPAEEGPAAAGPRVPEPPIANSKAGSSKTGISRTGSSKARESRATGSPPDAWTPPLSLLVHLAHQVLSVPPAGATGEDHGWGRTGPVLWIGRRVWPYGRALVRAGPKGARLLARSLFVAIPDDVAGSRGRVASEAGARLWALDLALRCRAVAAVVADGRGFAMAASRRLQVAAEAGHAFVVLARPPEEFDVPSAAAVRFVVTRTAIDADARPGAPRSCAWSLTLRRAKGAAARMRAAVVSPAVVSPAVVSPAALSPPSPSSSSSLRASSLRMAHGPEGPAVVLVWDAVHGVIEQGTVPAFAGGGARVHPGERGHAEPHVNAATDPGVVPAVVLDRPLAAATHASGSGGVRSDTAHSDAGRSDASHSDIGRPAEARRRRRTRTRR